MKLITTAIGLETEFKRLVNKYKKYYWATAWAGVSSNMFYELSNNRDRIGKIIVGIHFYQTHPDFIESFLDNDGIRFIMQPEGTFHPKVYLFFDNINNWELLIGSANFTKEAFTHNTEATALIDNNDINAKQTCEIALNLIERSWNEAKIFTEPELEKYRIAWENHRPKIESLSGRYGSFKKPGKLIHEGSITSMTWKEFISRVKNDPYGVENRLAVIIKAKELFNQVTHFKNLKNEERKFIAGMPNKLIVGNSIDWALFGSMKGAGIFKNKIIENDIEISKALDQIPLRGQITKAHYNNYLNYFAKSLPGNYIATASRLLAMKRPDTFVCLDSKNKSKLCKDFGVQQSEINIDSYWSSIIERIFDSAWWCNPNPQNEHEEKISEARAAFLDALYYEG